VHGGLRSPDRGKHVGIGARAILEEYDLVAGAEGIARQRLLEGDVALEDIARRPLRVQAVEDCLALRARQQAVRAADANVVVGLQQVAVERRRRAAAGDRERGGGEEKGG
jgi:hypothetical protein